MRPCIFVAGTCRKRIDRFPSTSAALQCKGSATSFESTQTLLEAYNLSVRDHILTRATHTSSIVGKGPHSRTPIDPVVVAVSEGACPQPTVPYPFFLAGRDDRVQVLC